MLILSTATTGGGDERNIILPVLDNFDSYFLNIMKEADYGGEIDDCIIHVFSVFEDESENISWGMPSNRIQRRKNYYGEKKWIKSIVFVLLFNPKLVAKMSLDDFRIQLCSSLVERLERPEMKILKAFDYDAFKNDMIKVIEIYKINESL